MCFLLKGDLTIDFRDYRGVNILDRDWQGCITKTFLACQIVFDKYDYGNRYSPDL